MAFFTNIVRLFHGSHEIVILPLPFVLSAIVGQNALAMTVLLAILVNSPSYRSLFSPSHVCSVTYYIQERQMGLATGEGIRGFRLSHSMYYICRFLNVLNICLKRGYVGSMISLKHAI